MHETTENVAPPLGGLIIAVYLILAIYVGRLVTLPYNGVAIRLLFVTAVAVYLYRSGGRSAVSEGLIGKRPISETLLFTVCVSACMLVACCGGRFVLEINGVNTGSGDLNWPRVLDNCLIAPINEEIVFSSLFIGALLVEWPKRPWLAVVFSSLVFAAVHHWDPTWKPVWLIFSHCIFGWLFLKTQNVICPTLAHSASNLAAILPIHEIGDAIP